MFLYDMATVRAYIPHQVVVCCIRWIAAVKSKYLMSFVAAIPPAAEQEEKVARHTPIRELTKCGAEMARALTRVQREGDDRVLAGRAALVELRGVHDVHELGLPCARVARSDQRQCLGTRRVAFARPLTSQSAP